MAGVKLSDEQKRLLNSALLGLQKSYQRMANKYGSEQKTEMVQLVQKELGKVAGLLVLIDQL